MRPFDILRQMTSMASQLSSTTPEGYSHRRGLRTVAAIEALKGVLAMLAAIGFILVLRRDVDVENAAENLLYFLHIDPDLRICQALLNAAGKIMDIRAETVLGIALAYSMLRFIEAYGLWRTRAWAEWLAIVSGAIYLPFEIYRIIEKPNAFHWAVLCINVIVVVYIAWVRWSEISATRNRRLTGSTAISEGD
jgi:uncharacterized membrane protein (DUF2068 family)